MEKNSILELFQENIKDVSTNALAELIVLVTTYKNMERAYHANEAIKMPTDGLKKALQNCEQAFDYIVNNFYIIKVGGDENENELKENKSKS